MLTPRPATTDVTMQNEDQAYLPLGGYVERLQSPRRAGLPSFPDRVK